MAPERDGDPDPEDVVVVLDEDRDVVEVIGTGIVVGMSTSSQSAGVVTLVAGEEGTPTPSQLAGVTGSAEAKAREEVYLLGTLGSG